MQMKMNIETVKIDNWSDVNWIAVNSTVKKLRRRIFDAKRNNNNKLVASLQKLMLNSTSNILFSIRKVSYDSGRKTAGIDKQTLDSPMKRIYLFKDIMSNGWDGLDPKPIRRIYIKEPNKMRPIGIPTIYDRVIQSMVLNSLEPEWEAVFEKGSYGFRPKRSVNDAVARIWLALNKENSRKWIVESDITKCFDSISHKYLLEKIDKFPGKSLIKKMLEVGIVIRDVWLSSDDEGTPQASVLSPLLCNIALHGLEAELGVKYKKNGFVDQRGRLLIRFADYLVIICHNKIDAEKAVDELALTLLKRGLEISKLKTKAVHVSEGFDFLGFNFKMNPKPYRSFDNSIIKIDDNSYKIIYDNVRVCVSPSRKSIIKIKSKLKKVLLISKGSSAKDFIKRLNPIIRGYVQSKYHWHSNKAFRHLDQYIYKLCWRWAIRRHPQKNYGWIREKYFKTLKIGNINNKCIFSYISEDSKNPLMQNDVYILKTYWFGITDYLLTKMDKLADNRKDEMYYKELEIKRFSRLKFNIFRKIDKNLMLSQNLTCPLCNDDLFNGEKIHRHHIIPFVNGGRSTFANLVYLHLACHYKVQSDYTDISSEFLLNYRKNHPRLNHKKYMREDVYPDFNKNTKDYEFKYSIHSDPNENEYDR